MSALGIGKWGVGAAGATVVVAFLAGCASSSGSGQSAGGGSSTASSVAPVTGSASGLKSASTSIGTVLVTTSGRTVYELVGDSAAKPTCTGGCLAVWPAVKANDTQVVVNGHPAYTFVGDKAAGQTKGQNLTDQWGRWLALDGSGKPVSGSGGGGSTAPSSQAAPSSQPSAPKSKAPSGGGPAF